MTTPEYDGPERRLKASDQPRIDQLEAATLRLSEQVHGLNTALLAVNTISEKTERLEKVVVPKDELIKKDIEQAKRMEQYRKTTMRRLVAWIGGMAVVVVAVSLAAANYAAGQQGSEDRYREQIYQICVARNAQSQVIRDIVARGVERAKGTPDYETAKQDADALMRAFPIINCEGVRG